MKMFGLNSLPADVKEKIDSIVWGDDFIDDIIGQVNLNDDWVFIDDESHIQGFSSRQDLIDMVRNDTRKVNI